MTDTERPRWTLSQAAKRCGTSRATLQRALNAGRIPGAVRDEQGWWQLPLEGLLAAGFLPDRPAPAEDQDSGPHRGGAREHARTPDPAPAEPASELVELRIELERERARADLERTRREAAEQLAAERAARVADLQHSLRMLEAGLSDRVQERGGDDEGRGRGLLGWLR